MGKQIFLLPLAVLISLGVQSGARAQAVDATASLSERGSTSAGKWLYKRRCALCHGTSGKGDGPVARYVFPKPRDLAAGEFKIRSTPSGGLPTDQDLFDTLTRGMSGTTMPSWANLTEAQRWNLVAYIKTLSPRFQEEDRLEPVQIGPPKPPYPESVANGRRLWIDAECWTCHGLRGKGDGPKSDELKDDSNYTIVPADLTEPRNWRGGYRPEDIYRSIAVGIGGTPMPSYADALDADAIWDLTNFLFSIIGGGE